MRNSIFILLFVIALTGSCSKNYEEPESSEQKSSIEVTPAPQPEQSEQTNEAAPVHENHESPAATSTQDFEMPPYHLNPENISLKATMDPATVTPAAQSGYIVAKEKPQMLAQLPCFCYCNRFGHTSLHDCFTTDHAVSCDICLKEAIEADQMQRSGLNIDEIRSVIVAKYRPEAENH